MTEDPIAAFYDRFPYPARDAGEPGHELVVPSNLPMVVHHVFGGRAPSGRPFRVLIAGGGTGDAVLSMGSGMRRFGISGAISYLDMSEAALSIARSRASGAGLDGVAFGLGPVESLAEGDASRFDYVDLCGVLNHVADPAAALRALSHVLAPGGGIGVMAYGALGRTGVYEAQEALRILGADAMSADGVALARAFVAGLPRDNWLARNPAFASLARCDDAEIADVLLNPRDRAFSVDGLVALMAQAGLEVRAFAPPFLYDPTAAVRDPALRSAAAGLGRTARWRLAELLQGCMNKHVLYAVKAGSPAPPAPDAMLDRPDTLLVPHGVDLPSVAAALAALPADRRAIRMAVEAREIGIQVRLTDLDLGLLAAIDGPTRIRALRERAGAGADEVGESLQRLVRVLAAVSMLHVLGV